MLYLSSPSLTEAMHCSSENFTAKYGQRSGFPLRTGHQLRRHSLFGNLFQHEKKQEIKTHCPISLHVETTLVTRSLFPEYGLLQEYCVICFKKWIIYLLYNPTHALFTL